MKSTPKLLKEKGVKRLREENPDIYRRNAARINHFKHLQSFVNDGPWMRELFCYFVWGPTGAGKTQWAHKHFPGLYSPQRTRGGDWWFDGYEGEEVILIEDLRPGDLSMRDVCNWLDHFKGLVHVRHSFVPKQWSVVIVTSQHPLDTLWPEQAIQGDPCFGKVVNRFHKIVHHTDINENPYV